MPDLLKKLKGSYGLNLINIGYRNDEYTDIWQTVTNQKTGK